MMTENEELKKIILDREDLIRKLTEMVRMDEEALGISAQKSCLRLLPPEDFDLVKRYY